MMNDVAAAEPAKISFSDLVKEAFIDPIRSVLIIDDQYPTWEQIFGVEGYDPTNHKRWTAKDKILEVIQQFRTMSPALTVDIHDGQHDEKIGSYLHQSDLLVLDYQLEEIEPHGVRATEIIAGLLRNNHFNLMIVHTAIGDLSDPFNTILTSLLTPLNFDKRKAAGLKLVEAIEDSTGNENAFEDIKGALPKSTYVALRAHLCDNRMPRDFVSDAPEMAKFREIVQAASWDEKQSLKVMYAGMAHHDKLVADHAASPRELRWSAPGAGKQPWIRTNGGFIAFAEKRNTDLLHILQTAIEDWRPSPSRLLSSRIRAEISLQGAGAEDAALTDRYAYWHYYQELRSIPADNSEQAAKSHRRTMLEGHAARHTERLLDLIGEKTVTFGLKILATDPTEADAEVPGFADHYAIESSIKEERDKALAHYNAHISTKPVSGWHLQPGHIFKVGQEMWVCLSPSCDLVPMQKLRAAVKESGAAAVKPFVAVRLTLKPEYTRAEVNSNTLIFFREGNSIKTYSIYPVDAEFGSPIWRLFMASDYGKFDIRQDRTADLDLSYLLGNNGTMQVKPVTAQIVGQLRYEYALNLIQKLGVEFTRIGLDFAAPENDEAQSSP